MNLVVLSIKPSLEHLVEDNSSSTKHLMTAITRTFQESSECPSQRKVLKHDVTIGASVGSASQKVLTRGGAVGGDNSELRRNVGRMQCGWQ